MANNTDWLNISPTSGSSGQTTLTLTASTNTGSTRKTATVKAYNTVCGITSMTYVVLHTLVPIPYTADTTPLPFTGESRTITIDASGLIPSSITISVSGATGVTYTYDNGVITVTFPENTGADEKTIDITVEGETQDGDIGRATISYLQKKNYANDYLTFTILNGSSEDADTGEFVFKCIKSNTGTPLSRTIQYSLNNGAWTNLSVSTSASDEDSVSVSVSPGDSIRLRGDNSSYALLYEAYSSYIVGSYCNLTVDDLPYKITGNIMSLIDSTNFRNITALQSNATFARIFSERSSSFSTWLLDAEDLILPATTLSYGCYDEMFDACNSLATAPDLPATTLADRCYEHMFSKCTSLTTAPALPATTLGSDCYNGMFLGCTSLTTAPALPATTLANHCYLHMFDECTSLTAAPALPATTMKMQCYSYMFSDCTSLTTAPVLPATTLSYSCYEYMFSGCTSLATAPELPATILEQICYGSMFYGCTSLTTAPVLPATTLSYGCYNEMFQFCENLNYIKCLATNISATNCTRDWVMAVASTGTFVKSSEMDDWPTGWSGIPSGWTVQNAT